MRISNTIEFNPDISEEGAAILQQIARPKEYRKKDNLLREGHTCKRLYFVQNGLLRTFRNHGGKDINISFTAEGQFTTDLKSLCSQQTSEVWIQAHEPTLVLEFDAQLLLNGHPQSTEIQAYGKKILQQLLDEQHQHQRLLRLPSAADRYFQLIRRRPDLFQRVSATHLSSYIGTSRETISRIRNA